ncbi:GNAT family N-acetyltransferase [Streptomyces iconiensis]|uniref:GNAT family N-acetyltransferase n=1 Tax=Streptomyces iconiensis TaxID=1384038 RepID=A0ABT6ZTA7_9ACTN|nr:GNAT family N-acetyltransferase [Streptomyces iconiensis]MDJ1132303.1 GNAT family N-acetyltransferase [Streptomyces iconiensis]
MGMSVTISAANEHDAEQILKLQYLCFQSEAELYGDYRIDPLVQTLDDFRAQLTRGCVVVARLGEEIVGSVRGSVDEDGTAAIGRLCVHPRLQGHGLGGRLLTAVEARLATEFGAKRYRLVTGNRSEGNLRLYRRSGYAPVGTERDRQVTLVAMAKDVGAYATSVAMPSAEREPAAVSAAAPSSVPEPQRSK